MIVELNDLAKMAELSQEPYLKALILRTQAKLVIDLEHAKILGDIKNG